ncbi:hypothetical protein KEM56_003727 [Ascosphaera pollenicola]|nr:hypothetical protein KEM56_003727 [Ascosphaera pollenicola]
MPIIFAMYKGIPQIRTKRQAAFVGFFGPVGVGAIFYLYLTREYISQHITVDGKPREDVARLSDTIELVIWFVVLCSVTVHGLAVPCGKLCLKILRMSHMRKDHDEESFTASHHTSFLPSFFIRKSRNLPFSEQPTMANTPAVSIAKPDMDGEELQRLQRQQQQQDTNLPARPVPAVASPSDESGAIELGEMVRNERPTTWSESTMTMTSSCSPAAGHRITFGGARTSSVD